MLSLPYFLDTTAMAMLTDGVIHWKIFMAMMMVKVTIMVTTEEMGTIVVVGWR